MKETAVTAGTSAKGFFEKLQRFTKSGKMHDSDATWLNPNQTQKLFLTSTRMRTFWFVSQNFDSFGID